MSAADMICPHCSASMRGEPIPEEHLQHEPDCEERKARSLYGNCYCLPWGESTHFSRVMGHEIRDVYDGVLYWSCPDCGKAWPRWNDGEGRLSFEAAKYVAVHNNAIEEAAS